jgi:glycosyltransferase involved in cell wall biosynthesis
MSGMLIAAVRDLDPPAGGAEMSLATLLKGVGIPGPLADVAPEYVPLEPSRDTADSMLTQGWSVSALQSGARGTPTELTEDSQIARWALDLPVEDLWSGLAWRLSEKSGQPRKSLQRRHLRKTNAGFAKAIDAHISTILSSRRGAGTPVVGVTQLHWSAGAAQRFSAHGIPYVVFVRDELQFRHPSIYRASLEGAAAVCCAGAGLGKQVAETFDVKSIRNVRLPVDFAGRFGSSDGVNEMREKGMAARSEDGGLDVPRIAIIGVTPEKGAEFYTRLLPRLAESWPEARVDVHGGGSYAEALGKFSNTTWHGHTPVEEVFSRCDVHLLTVASTGSWGRVVNEAGLFGVPTVSVATGSQPEAVGEGGIVVSADSGLDDWVSALKQAHADRDSLGEMAREHCGIVDHRRSIAAFRSVLNEVA